MKKTLIVCIVLVALIGVGFLFLNQKPKAVITNFEECVTAGNPVMESYPRQCIHDGITYVEKIKEPTDNIPTSADNAPPGSIHNLPVPQAVSAVKKYVAEKAGVSEGLVIVLTAYEKEWSDGCLGLGGPAESCLAAITPGYEVTVQVKGTKQKYRTNADGSEIRNEK